MAAGGFRTFVAGETLDEDKINDFLMQGVLVFDDAAARDAAITAPVHGQIAFLKDSDKLFFYDGVLWDEVDAVPEGAVIAWPIQYLVIAGGGGSDGSTSGSIGKGGGGAGGYRCNVVGEPSGGGASAEVRALLSGTYTITVGAGGAGGTGGAGFGTNGSNSVFGPITSTGGGKTLGAGGSGGGGQFNNVPGGAGTIREGFKGGDATGGTEGGQGGGGAGEAGNTDGVRQGGDGVSSSITGSAVIRGGGGGGGGGSGAAAGGVGGDGGGGTGGTFSSPANGTSGTVNTGGGGGGAARTSSGDSSGGSGGSGIVIFGVITGTPISFSGGVTQTSATVGDNTVYTVTATSTTSETVTIG
jgi:hypothetical protein